MTYGRVTGEWDEVWIVAGGQSARAFDSLRLRGQNVLAVNDAIFLRSIVGASTVTLFSLDNNWIRRHREFASFFPGEKYFALPLETWPDCGGIPGATYLQWSHDPGLSDDLAFISTGGNSGHGAINLAYHKRAKVIHLVGYDMDLPDEKFAQWAPRFRNTLPQLRARGACVLNHNMKSAIDAYEKVA